MADNDDTLKKIQDALLTYKPPTESLRKLSEAKILLIVSITSAGKNSITRKLVQTGSYYFMISHTTRIPRMNEGVLERDGKEYYFISNDQLLMMLKQGEFFECKYIHGQQFSGISLSEIRKAVKLKMIAVSDVEVQGVHEFKSLLPTATAVFILPPSFDEWQRRLEARGKLSRTERARRFKSAQMELETALKREYYHFVVNDDLDSAVIEIDKHAKNKSLLNSKKKQGKELAEKLLEELNTKLG